MQKNIINNEKKWASGQKCNFEENGGFNIPMYLQELARHFALYFPFDFEKVREYHYDPDLCELIFITEDGHVGCYDDMENTIRYIFRDHTNISDSEYKKEFGRRLCKIMSNKLITQTDLSKMTGITQHMISKYVTGKSAPSIVNAIKIIKALDCLTDTLIIKF